MRLVAQAIAVILLVAPPAARAAVLPPALPAQVTWRSDAGKELTLAGELVFESWPVLENGKAATISKESLIPSQLNPAEFVRAEGKAFTFRGARGQRTVEFAFDKLPVRLSESKELAAALDRGFRLEVAQELEGESHKPPPPPPVVFGVAEKPAVEQIPVAQIISIRFKALPGVNMQIGGRFLAYSRKVKGSNGAVRLLAATFFGGPADERFAGGAFLADGSIVAIGSFADLSFAGDVAQTVIGKDAPDAEPKTTPVLARFSPDLTRITGITRLAWGAGEVKQVMSRPDGTVYVSWRGAADSFIAKLSPDATALAWTAAFAGKDVQFGLRPDGQLLVESGKTYWIISADGQVRDGPQRKAAIRDTRKMPLAVSPHDGAFYIGGDYNSATGFEPYRNPYLHRFDADGTCRWTAWNWTGPMVGTYFRQVSDSRAVGVRFCRNGDLLVIGWSDGGNTVLSNLPYDLEKSHGKYGFFNDMSAAGVGSFCHLLRMDAATMEVKAATYWMSYQPFAQKNGQPNSASTRDIVEMEDGRFALAGSTAYAMIETPDAWVKPFIAQWNENPATARPRGGSCFAVFDAEFRALQFCSMTPAVRNQALAARGNRVLLVGGAGARDTSYGMDEAPLLVEAIQKQHGGGESDGYLMLIEVGK